MAKARRMKEKARKIKITIQRNRKLKSAIQIISIIIAILAVIFLVENTAGDGTIEQNIKSVDGESLFKLELANESDTDFEERDIKVIFQNRDKTTFEEIEYHIDTIKSHESSYIATSINRDLTKAKDFYIENK